MIDHWSHTSHLDWLFRRKDEVKDWCFRPASSWMKLSNLSWAWVESNASDEASCNELDWELFQKDVNQVSFKTHLSAAQNFFRLSRPKFKWSIEIAFPSAFRCSGWVHPFVIQSVWPCWNTNKRFLKTFSYKISPYTDLVISWALKNVIF